jgi:hypothetical protein
VKRGRAPGASKNQLVHRGRIVREELKIVIARNNTVHAWQADTGLASNHDGEVLATVRAIRRILASSGADLHDLCIRLAPVRGAQWREEVTLCRQYWKALSAGEQGLIESLEGMARRVPKGGQGRPRPVSAPPFTLQPRRRKQESSVLGTISD